MSWIYTCNKCNYFGDNFDGKVCPKCGSSLDTCEPTPIQVAEFLRNNGDSLRSMAVCRAIDALEAKDAEIASLKAEADLWWSVARRKGKGCPEGHSPRESRGACWFCDAERNAADLAALREAVGAIPGVQHIGLCPLGQPDVDCVCGAADHNAALAAARKLAESTTAGPDVGARLHYCEAMWRDGGECDDGCPGNPKNIAAARKLAGLGE